MKLLMSTMYNRAIGNVQVADDQNESVRHGVGDSESVYELDSKTRWSRQIHSST